MSRPYENPIHVLTLEVLSEDVDVLLPAIRDQWDIEPVQFTRPRHASIWLDLYFEDAVQAQIAEKLYSTEPRVRSRHLRVTRAADWQAAFRQQFSTKLVGKRLRICPVWEAEDAPVDERINLWVDPGLSFGTGEHFTTSFCLEMIDRLWLDSAPNSFLDVGCGSGLLAIAAARLGCGRVQAIENDAGVLDYTRENFERNGVADTIELRHQDVRVDALPGRWDMVCANLVSGLLMECGPALTRATGRWLVITGIREIEADGVAAVYAALGGEERIRDGDGEWVGMVFEWKEPANGPVAGR